MLLASEIFRGAGGEEELQNALGEMVIIAMASRGTAATQAKIIRKLCQAWLNPRSAGEILQQGGLRLRRLKIDQYRVVYKVVANKPVFKDWGHRDHIYNSKLLKK